MVDTKISDLVEETSPADNDEFVIVDVSATDDNNKVLLGTIQVSDVQTSTATGTVTQRRVQTLVLNNNAADIVITLDGTVAAGNYLEILALDTFGAGSGHTVKLPAGVTYDGTNNTATFDADLEKLYCRAITATRFFVDNPDSVAFTST